MITAAQYIDASHDTVLVNGSMCVPAVEANRHYREVLAWVATGNVIANENPPPAPPTNDEAYATILENRAIKGLIKVCASKFNMSPGQIKAAIKAQM